LVVCDHFDAFISYRRETGSDLASLLKMQLENRFHKRIFLDVNELQVGKFDEELLRRIEEAPNFILILSRASLDRCANKSDWLKREIMHALTTGRNIIPVLTDNFSFPSEEVWSLLPPEMHVLPSLNGVTYSHIYQDSALRKTASFMKTEIGAHEDSIFRPGNESLQPPENQHISPEKLKLTVNPTGARKDIARIFEAHESITGSGTISMVPAMKSNLNDKEPTGSATVSKSFPSPTLETLVVEATQPPDNLEHTPQATSKKTEVQTGNGKVSFNPDSILFIVRGEDFFVGTKDSKVRSFYYGPGTVVQYYEKGTDGDCPGYQLRGASGEDMWFAGYSWLLDAIDKRVFFKIAETGWVGYLVEILGDRLGPWGSLDKITIDENLLGTVEIKSDTILSMTANKDEMFVQTKESGTFTGKLQNMGNYNWDSFTMGPCLVTCDAVIPLVRTNRVYTITLNRIDEMEKPLSIPELLYSDRSQLKFSLPARAGVGYFDECVRDSYIHFVEQSLGWIRISIPQIKRFTVDLECKEAPVVIDTFAGNVYRGTCPEKFNISGTMISFDKVKNLVLEAFDREGSSP
jgi:hypothetical protein